jgi:hypothetical protein
MILQRQEGAANVLPIALDARWQQLEQQEEVSLARQQDGRLRLFLAGSRLQAELTGRRWSTIAKSHTSLEIVCLAIVIFLLWPSLPYEL